MSLSRLLLSTEGRIPRSTLWYFLLSCMLLSFFAAAIDLATGLYDRTVQIGFLSALLSLALVIPEWCIGAKRCHDLNRPNWYLFIGLIPWVGPLWLFISLGFVKGTAGDNKYGADPCRRAAQP